jgi:hypothetical protein
MRRMKLIVKELITSINESQTMHELRKQLKMDEDPWDNYLVYDAKYYIPLLCHGNELKIEEQILVAMFIRQALVDENISQYRPKGNHLIKELIQFAQDFKDDEDEPNALERIRKVALSYDTGLDEARSLEEELERLIKMFYLHMRV